MMIEVILFAIFIYFIPGLLPTKHWLRFYACYIKLGMLGIILPFLLTPIQLTSVRLFSKIIIGVFYLEFMMMGIKWDVRNKDHFQKYKNGIVVVNHQSVLDIIGIITLNNGFENITGVAKKELLRFPPLAFFLRNLGVVFIDRTKSKQAMGQMEYEISKIKDSSKVLIFPEGTRNKKGDGLLQFKRGAFRVAIALKLPVIPVVMSPYTFIKHGEKFSDGKEIVSCLEPIETVNLSMDDVDNLMEKTRELMQAEYFKLSAELGKNNNIHSG